MRSPYSLLLTFAVLTGCNPPAVPPPPAPPSTPAPPQAPGPAEPASSLEQAAGAFDASLPATEVAANEPEASQRAADVPLVLADYDGIMKLVASKKGKVVVMDAWSTWCEPCVKEFPGLVRLHERLGPEKVACISLSCDYDGLGAPEELRDGVLTFLTEQKAAFDNVLASEDSETIFKKLGIPSVPAIFVYDQEGQLARKFDSSTGKVSYEDVSKLVDELLAAGE